MHARRSPVQERHLELDQVAAGTGQKKVSDMKHRATLLFSVLTLASSAAAYLAFAPAAAEAPATQLQKVVEEVVRKFPDVAHVSEAEFDEMRQSDGVVVIDARSAEEFAVSHLEGAVNVDPKISAEEFAVKVAPSLKDKTAVVYCSVGMRSSKLAQRIAEAAKAAGARRVANLEGGIFAWANASRPLVDANGPTTKVHGYDASWGKLLERN